jgi:hypothetical protein
MEKIRKGIKRSGQCSIFFAVVLGIVALVFFFKSAAVFLGWIDLKPMKFRDEYGNKFKIEWDMDGVQTIAFMKCLFCLLFLYQLKMIVRTYKPILKDLKNSECEN